MSERVPAYVREHGPLELPVRVLRFGNEIARLRKEPGWQKSNRLARTLAKEGGLSVVLSLMKAGAIVQEHHAEGPVTLQCLEGRMRLHTAGHPIDLLSGEMVVLDGKLPHRHEALTDCAVLLLVSRAAESTTPA
ncbi:MAG TPA: cupin domain-containing protein [Dehalococcoidia bacterium]|nr:cupin domain-containing protein [Dehalococcoidia bacterium]